MINLKIKKHNTKGDFVKTIVEETKDIAEQCETIALKNNMKNIEDSILEVISLESMDNKTIYDKYRYKIWNKLSTLVQKYLCKRFDLKLFERQPIPNLHCVRFAIATDPVGIALEKYAEFSNTKKIKSALGAFSSAELINIFCAVTEEINKRKEQEDISVANWGERLNG